MIAPRRLILASGSPRRLELLALLGLPFDVIPSEIDEEDIANPGDPRLVAEALACEKAWDLVNRIRYSEITRVERNIILAADTIVVVKEAGRPAVLGKPRNAADARRMLSLLSGVTHTVYTGLCVMECDWYELEEDWIPMWNTAVAETEVVFRELSPEIIDAYIVTGEPFDKAGAYGIQGFASTFVEGIQGDYFNVVGLPIATVARMLENIGIEWWRGEAALEPTDSPHLVV